MMIKRSILVIALITIVAFITPVNAETQNTSVYYDSFTVDTGLDANSNVQIYIAGYTSSWYAKWYSNNNLILPSLRSISLKSEKFLNTTSMPLSTSYIDTIYWYKASDPRRLTPIASGILTYRIEDTCTTYGYCGVLSLTMTDYFSASDLTGTTEWFNTSVSGNQSYYGLSVYSGREKTLVPFGAYDLTNERLMAKSSTKGYSFWDYETHIDLELSGASSSSGLPITFSLTPETDTSSVNWYLYYPGNSTVFAYQTAVGTNLETKYLSSPVNPTGVKINQTGTTGFLFDQTYTFLDGFTTPTPTPTPTPAPTIPTGYVRTYAYTSDCISGARIAETDISFYNHNTSAWSNSSQDTDGKFYIDTLPYQTISIYGAYTKTASQYGTDSYTYQNVGLYGGQSFALQLCPTQLSPGTGNTNVLVTVYDTTNYLPLQYTTVSLKLTSTGATTIDSTGTSGTASFVTTNNSVITLTASKSGYITGSKTLTTSSTTLTTAKIYLDKQIITTAPTLTAVPGGTIPTTIDPAGTSDSAGNYPSGYSNMKGQQMLDWLAANGMMLVQLCFMVTVLALFGVKFGK